MQHDRTGGEIVHGLIRVCFSTKGLDCNSIVYRLSSLAVLKCVCAQIRCLVLLGDRLGLGSQSMQFAAPLRASVLESTDMKYRHAEYGHWQAQTVTHAHTRTHVPYGGSSDLFFI